MTRERAKELLPIIKAYSEGKEIQWNRKTTDSWEMCHDGLTWSDVHNYRIKPETKVVPYTYEEALTHIGKLVSDKRKDCVAMIT